MATERFALATILALSLAAPVAAQDPLSAIDWLESGPDLAVATPLPGSTARRPTTEPPVARSGASPAVEVMPLDAPSAEAVGLLPMSATGLPPSLWSASQAAVLVPLIGAVDPSVPALSALLYTLLLAEANPPQGASSAPSLLAARLDRLREEGAVEPALALIERAGGARNAALFSRWFDLALLLGEAEAPCRMLQSNRRLSDDLPTRIYCDARTGDWNHAVTVFGTAQALGQIPQRDADLLLRFLEPDLIEGATPLRAPARPTPLEFRLFEAIGEALPTQPLPRAFAVADLEGNSGWRAQILAAERLAEAGAISENRLLGIYSDRKPAASGGVWDRVSAVQALEAALRSGRTDLAGPALWKAWPQMRSAGMLVPFGRLYGAQLATLGLDGPTGAMAQRAGLLSQDYETVAGALTPKTDAERLLQGIARGDLSGGPLPSDARSGAIAAAWQGATVPEPLASMLAQGRLGEVILRAMSLFASGAEGNNMDLTGALATLRAVGLEDTARRAALQYLILADEGALR